MIYVESKSQKGIVIGKGGRMIRDVGQAAREELERVLGTKIYLGLRVKVHPRWRDDPRVLREMEPGTADLREPQGISLKTKDEELGIRISVRPLGQVPGLNGTQNSKLKTHNWTRMAQ